MAEQIIRRKAELIGKVVSDKMDKTITVEVMRRVRHPRYGKFVRRSTICKAHDEKNDAKMGDKVRILEARPTSKTKRWRLAEVVTRRQGPAEVSV